MHLQGLLIVGLLLTLSGTATASDKRLAAKDAAQNAPKTTEPKPDAKASDAKELSGISIVGNDEAPKSLYIVPWKGSELGEATSMGMDLDERATPVDRDVFKRQLDYYEVSNRK
ncbi:MAG: hypothetical protein HGB21_14300 [Nitrospirae bacterium]|nr:hypothetical protein [Nitrospirota bacterium]NTW67455.1 hypothetical protein [Nitrospirota bacterium]